MEPIANCFMQTVHPTHAKMAEHVTTHWMIIIALVHPITTIQIAKTITMNAHHLRV